MDATERRQRKMLRNGLRINPLDADAIEIASQPVPRTHASKASQRLLTPAVIGLFALVCGLVLGRRPIGLVERQLTEQTRQNQTQQAKISDQNQQIQTLRQQLQQMRTTCDDASREQGQIGDFVARGRLDLAVGIAETKLAQQAPRLCESAQAALAGYWYTASMDNLFNIPRPDWPGSEVEQQMVARWLDIERQADLYAVPNDKRWAPMSTAVRAYNSELWALADAAFRKAWAKDETSGEMVLFRYNLLRNWGYNLAHKGGPDQRSLAERILATAQAVAERYSLPRLEACQDLVDLGNKDCGSVAPDANDPVLTTAKP
jgi:hypothetical protein